ncbi:MAG: hypothetical protein AAFQ79_17280 [Pseudomonadota bacterium]
MPDILRFGIAPLSLGETEIDPAVAVLHGHLWERWEYKVRSWVM